MSNPSQLEKLSKALMTLSTQIESPDGLPELLLLDAALTVGQIQEALVVVAPVISHAAGSCSRRSKEGKRLRAAVNMLMAGVLA